MLEDGLLLCEEFQSEFFDEGIGGVRRVLSKFFDENIGGVQRVLSIVYDNIVFAQRYLMALCEVPCSCQRSITVV